jgi:hypothetical protein
VSASGPDGGTVPAGTRVLIGAPAVPPSAEALDAARAALEATLVVRRAAYAMLGVSDQEPVLTFGLEPDRELDERATRAVFDAVAIAIMPHLPPGTAFNFAIADADLLAAFQRSTGPAFYVREGA